MSGNMQTNGSSKVGKWLGLDRSGELRKGLFYRVYASLPRIEEHAIPTLGVEEWLMMYQQGKFSLHDHSYDYSTHPRLSFFLGSEEDHDKIEYAISWERDEWSQCGPVNKHRGRCIIDRMFYCYDSYWGYGGEPGYAGIQDFFLPTDRNWLIRKDVHEEIMSQRFLGYEARLAEHVHEMPPEPLPEHFQPEPLPKGYQDVYFVRLATPEVLRPRVLHPDRNPSCPYCLVGKVFCDACDTLLWPCSNCGKDPFFNDGLGKSDGTNIYVKWDEGPSILEGKRIKKRDFLGWSNYYFISRRVLNFLTSRHYGPFFADPIEVDIAGMTEDEIKELEELSESNIER